VQVRATAAGLLEGQETIAQRLSLPTCPRNLFNTDQSTTPDYQLSLIGKNFNRKDIFATLIIVAHAISLILGQVIVIATSLEQQTL
jgi:hypothetical protein